MAAAELAGIAMWVSVQALVSQNVERTTTASSATSIAIERARNPASLRSSAFTPRSDGVRLWSVSEPGVVFLSLTVRSVEWRPLWSRPSGNLTRVPTTDDLTTAPSVVARRAGIGGLGYAFLSASSFGLSGVLGKGLLETGWTAGAAVLLRVTVAALVLAIPTVMHLRGSWGALRRHVWLVVAFGLVPVAGTQFCFFQAVARLPVGIALLLEYTAPVVIIGWLWVRHGHRPSRLTVIGAAIAVAGLLLVLDVVTGRPIDPVGAIWALVGMIGAATYFVLGAHDAEGLPPIALAGGGMVVGALGLSLCGLLGVIPMSFMSASVALGGRLVPWWVDVLALGVLTAAIAYASGIAASRRLGSRLASFVALTEVLFALLFAWLLLGELPRLVQLFGGLVLLAGVALVKLGEGHGADVSPEPLA